MWGDELHLDGGYASGVFFYYLAPLAAYLAWRALSSARSAGVRSTLGSCAVAAVLFTLPLGVNAAVQGHRAWPWMLVGLLMLALLGALTERLAFWSARGRLSSGAAAVYAVGVYLLVPAFAFDWPPYVLLLPGWRMALSAYSLLAESRRCGRAPARGAALRFMVVDPTHVFSDTARRWKGPVGVHGRGLLRMAGWAVLLLGMMWLGPRLQSATTSSTAWLAPLVWFGTQCAAHVAAASLQTALAGMAGGSLPACYRAPWLARSPQDFWRRWNRWVGRWAELHVFVPMARHALAWPGNRRGIANATALFVTFLVVGLLHDLYGYALFGWTSFGATGAFLVMYLLGLAWLPLSRGIAVLPGPAVLRRGMTRVAFLGAVYLASAYWGAL